MSTSSKCGIDEPLSLDKKYTLARKVEYGGVDFIVNRVTYAVVHQTDDLETAEEWKRQDEKDNFYFETSTPEVKKHVEHDIKYRAEYTEPWFEIYKPTSRKDVIKAFGDLGIPEELADEDADSDYYNDVWFFVIGKDRKRVVLETKGKKSKPSGFVDGVVKLFTINQRENAVGRKVGAIVSGNAGYVHLWNVDALECLDYVFWDEKET